MNEEVPQDLQYRILQLLDGELNRDEVAQLDAELKNDPQARQLYLQLAELHNALHTRNASRAEIGHSPLISIENLMARQRRRMFTRTVMATAAILMVSLVTLWMIMVDRKPATIVYFQVAPDSVFSLTHAVEEDETPHEVPNYTLEIGSRLKLSSGLLEGNFKSGVRFVLEGPCEFVVLAEDRIVLSQGIGWFDVPPDAIGFSVETPQMNIVDLGTQFGILALSDKSHEIHVIKGSVDAFPGSPDSGKNKIILKAGQARRMDENGNFMETPLNTLLFPTSLNEALRVKNSNFDALGELSKKNDVNGYGPIDHWATSGEGIGISSIDQPFLDQPAHSGTHVAFIQYAGAISQSVSGFDPSKRYTVTYFANERGITNASTSTSVSLDLGTTNYTQPDPIIKTPAFRRIVSGPLTVFGPTANIQISAKPLTGDASLLIDSVSITRAVPSVPDGGFENPVQPFRAFKQGVGNGSGTLIGSTWKFTDGGGITANYSSFLPSKAPEGAQAGLLQNSKAAFETTVQGFEPGVTYSISFEAAGRVYQGTAAFQVGLNGTLLKFKGSETIIPNPYGYQTFTSENFTVSHATKKLHFEATSDGTSYIDDIRFNFVAEAP